MENQRQLKTTGPKSLNEEIKIFLRELNHPEGFGWAVTQEVRDSAKKLLLKIERTEDDWK